MNSVNKAKAGHNRYCGPAALSILSGCDTRQAAALIRQISGRPYVKGTHRSVLVRGLEQLGHDLSTVMVKGRPSLVRWLKDTRESRSPDQRYLLIAGNHYCIIQGQRYCCGLTGKPVRFSAIPHRRARVTFVWQVEKVREGLPLPVPPPCTPAYVGDKRQVLRIAERIDLEIDTSDFHTNGWVYVYAGASHLNEDGELLDDPFDGEHIGCGWDEALQKAQGYETFFSQKK